MNNHFRCIGIVGHPRHPTALTTHEMLYRWLCGKGYEVMVEQQIARGVCSLKASEPARWRKLASRRISPWWSVATAICWARRERWLAMILRLLVLTVAISVS